MLGWKYFKKLQSLRLAAILAYARGYLGGMDANNRYEQEGSSRFTWFADSARHKLS